MRISVACDRELATGIESVPAKPEDKDSEHGEWKAVSVNPLSFVIKATDTGSDHDGADECS